MGIGFHGEGARLVFLFMCRGRRENGGDRMRGSFCTVLVDERGVEGVRVLLWGLGMGLCIPTLFVARHGFL